MVIPCGSHGLRPVTCFSQVVTSPQRVISFIDGFNLYHAISTLRRPELKWTDLRALSRVFLKSHSEELVGVYYFSAYAEHVTEAKQKRTI